MIAGRVLAAVATLLVLGLAAVLVLNARSTTPDADLGGQPDAGPSPTAAPAEPERGSGTLGTLVAGEPGAPECLAGFDCRDFSVTCPGLGAPANGTLATAAATDDPRGMLVLFSGGAGTGWWSGDDENRHATAFFEELRGAGLGLVQVRWQDSWLAAPAGEQAGPAALACRSATATAWIHDQLYAPLGVADAAAGVCGFCLTGNSGGASQIAYALGEYGLGTITDAAVLSSGPPHAGIGAGCLRPPDAEAGWFTPRDAARIDRSYGFTGGQDGPCVAGDEAFAAQWDADDATVAGPGAGTRLAVLVGGSDRTAAPAHARIYADAVAGSLLLEVPSMHHVIANSRAGLDALAAALLRP